MGLNTQQLVSDEAARPSGQEQADNEYNLFWARGGHSTPDGLAGRGPVLGSSATEYFPSRRGHVTEQIGAWNGMSGVPPLGSKQAQAGADVAYPRVSIGSIGIEERQGGDVGGSMSFNSLNSFYRDHQDFLTNSLQSMSLTAPLPSNPVVPMMQTTANSAAPSSPCPLRPPPHPPIPRSRLQGSTTHMSILSPSSSGAAPSRLAHAPPFNPSVLAPSIESLPSAATLLQRSMLPRPSASDVRDRGLSSVAESLLGMPFRGLHMSAGEGAHQPRLAAEGLAEILLALERVERDEDLTYEQLLMLEATLLFGGMGLHDQHSDLRLDVDNMSYEVLYL